MNPHGTRNRYAGGCRCDLCRDANRLYAKEMSDRRRGRLAEMFDQLPHGSANTYRNWGCRCDACRAVSHDPEMSRAYREQNREKLATRQRAWSAARRADVAKCRPQPRQPDEWTEQAACRNHPDPAAFFPVRRNWRTEQTRAVLALCATCPVRAECLEEAVRLGDDHGIRGGLSGRERRLLREARP